MIEYGAINPQLVSSLLSLGLLLAAAVMLASWGAMRRVFA